MLGIFGILCARDFRRIQNAMEKMKLADKSVRNFSQTKRGIYFRVDSVDKVDSGLSA